MTTDVMAFGYQDNWWPILTSPFMTSALAGGTIVALAAGLIGYFVVVRNTAFAAHALAHIGLPGATGAVLLGLPVALGLGVFCVGGALVIGVLGDRRSDTEVATGTVLALATGFGLFFNSLATKSSSTMTNVLFGINTKRDILNRKIRIRFYIDPRSKRGIVSFYFHINCLYNIMW